MLLTHTSGIIDGAGYNRAISRGIFPSLDVVMQSNNFSAAAPVNATAIPTSVWDWSALLLNRRPVSPFGTTPKVSCSTRWGWTPVFMTNDIDDPQTIAALGSVDPLSWGDMEKAYSQIPLGQMYLLGQGNCISAPLTLQKSG